jgi:hypothetical protein
MRKQTNTLSPSPKGFQSPKKRVKTFKKLQIEMKPSGDKKSA